MGKSACAHLFREAGIPLADTDLLARQLVEPGQPCLAEIVRAFGPQMLDAAGRLRREELGRQVFHNPSARQQLEAILHPPIRAAWKAAFDTWQAEGRPLAVADIPLLFETQAQAEFDGVICVACSERTQRQRLLSRGWSEAEMDRRQQAQWPIQRKMDQSDVVLWNESSLEVLREQLVRVFHAYGFNFHA